MKEQEENQVPNNELPAHEIPGMTYKPNNSQAIDHEKAKEDMTRNQKEPDKKEILEFYDRQEKKKSPKRIIRDCLEESFNATNIRSFCLNHTELEKIPSHSREGDPFDSIIDRLIQYCYENGIDENLWDCIRQDRERQYSKYYPKWKKAKEATHKNHNDQFFDPLEFRIQQKPITSNEVIRDHPLSGDDKAAINSWYHNGLNSEEKSMVLTVALFKGINRKHMTTIACEIQHILFETT